MLFSFEIGLSSGSARILVVFQAVFLCCNSTSFLHQLIPALALIISSSARKGF